MGIFFILKKGHLIVAVSIMSKDASERIKKLENDGYKIISDNFAAYNEKHAVNRWLKSTTSLKYKTTILVSTLIIFLGCGISLSGIITFIAAIEHIQKTYTETLLEIILISPGILLFIFGLLLITLGELVRATIDNANNTLNILNKLI